MNATTFSILYEDEQLVAINKPVGILVHRTKISEDQVFVLQLLRQQLGQRLYPIHRLDRATSGVLILGKNSEAAAMVAAQLRAQEVEKEYLAVVRGYVEEKATIDYPLAAEPHLEKQEAISHYQRLEQTEIAQAVGRYPTARYSLVRIQTDTGRRHQIRRHFSHLRHPIIGDKRHGDVKHNKFFQNTLDIPRMLLHAQKLVIKDTEGNAIRIEAPLDKAFQKALDYLQFEIPSNS